jgi:hypothetical protein
LIQLKKKANVFSSTVLVILNILILLKNFRIYYYGQSYLTIYSLILNHKVAVVKHSATIHSFIYSEEKTKTYSLWLGPVGSYITTIAATLLLSGRTCHSVFQLPLDINESSSSGMSLNSTKARVIKNAHIIIWDEAPMANLDALNCVDRLLRKIMGPEYAYIPFGGKTIVLGYFYFSYLLLYLPFIEFHL